MIEIISDAACIDCDKCVEVCPTNVFDAVPGGHPVIARQSDCQTCFMCEAYCPVDALYVAPFRGPVSGVSAPAARFAPAAGAKASDARPSDPGPVTSPRVTLDEERLVADGRFGEYRRWIGWGAGRRPGSLRDANAELPELAAAYLDNAAMQ